MDGIQLKTSNQTFVDPPTIKQPSPSLIRIEDIDITDALGKDHIDLNKIDSLTALKLLDILIKHLIKVEETNNEDEDSDDTPCDESAPFSPKKANYSDNDYVLETDKQSTQKKSEKQESALVKRFNLKHLPDLTPTQYLERINKYCGLSTAVYLTCILYLYKLVIQLKVIRITSYNIHRLLIAALRVSCKTLEDINHRQQFIAKIGGVNLDDLKLLEISFLFLLNFDCQSNATLLNDAIDHVKQLVKDDS